MAIVDFILNLVGLLLWLHWRSLRFDPLSHSVPATLAGTVRPASRDRAHRWYFLTALVILLLLRALVYWGIGSPANWTARLDLGLVTLTFRSDARDGMLLFSWLSFARFLLVCYFWFLVLNVLNHRNRESGPVERLVRLHLGILGRWPWPLQLITPILAAVLAWMALNPLLAQWSITAPAESLTRLVLQGLLVSCGLLLSLKFVLPFILLLHLLTSYVYLGGSPLWEFVSATARNLLRPLDRLPLRLAKFDFAPVLLVALIFLLLDALPRYLLLQVGTGKFNLWVQ